jgi:hypothetical protein
LELKKTLEGKKGVNIGRHIEKNLHITEKINGKSDM